MMKLPKTKSAWKSLQPNNIKDALRLCKEYARQFERLTVPAIAELIGTSEDTLYKWLSTGAMPAYLIPAYENVCGIDYVSRYLVYRNHKLIIDIPTGKKAKQLDTAEFQRVAADAISKLVTFYADHSGLEETTAALTNLISGAAYHRENINTQPELDFEEGDHND